MDWAIAGLAIAAAANPPPAELVQAGGPAPGFDLGSACVDPDSPPQDIAHESHAPARRKIARRAPQLPRTRAAARAAARRLARPAQSQRECAAPPGERFEFGN